MGDYPYDSSIHDPYSLRAFAKINIKISIFNFFFPFYFSYEERNRINL